MRCSCTPTAWSHASDPHPQTTDVNPSPRFVPRSFELLDSEVSLLKALTEYSASENNVSNTKIRIAGGWVRDKLLKRTCCDIDVVLDNVTGEQFLESFITWRSTDGDKISFGIIRSNPTKSKHLETVTAVIGIFSVDFVNLRSETYAKSSRIPCTTEFGNPLTDAHRRDFTINSLFYNLETDMIEDWTGRGLHDIEHGIINTPLPPFLTFVDDALRLLRGIRFSVVFNFQCNNAIFTAAQTEQVRHCLNNNISRERIGMEVRKTLQSTSALDFFRIICDEAKIHDIIFPICKKYATQTCKGLDLVHRLSLVTRVTSCECPHASFSDTYTSGWILSIPEKLRIPFVLSTFLTPFYGYRDVYGCATETERAQKMNDDLWDSLRLKKKERKKASHIYEGSLYWLSVLRTWQSSTASFPKLSHRQLAVDDEFDTNRHVVVGLLVRYVGEEYWLSSLALAWIIFSAESHDASEKTLRQVYDTVQTMGLRNIMMPLILNGNKVMSLLTNRISGPTLGDVLHYELQVLLNCPSISLIKLKRQLQNRFQRKA